MMIDGNSDLWTWSYPTTPLKKVGSCSEPGGRFCGRSYRLDRFRSERLFAAGFSNDLSAISFSARTSSWLSSTTGHWRSVCRISSSPNSGKLRAIDDIVRVLSLAVIPWDVGVVGTRFGDSRVCITCYQVSTVSAVFLICSSLVRWNRLGVYPRWICLPSDGWSCEVSTEWAAGAAFSWVP